MEGSRVAPGTAHDQWSSQLTAMAEAELRSYADHVRNAADKLGIWEHGGNVPMQPFVIGAPAYAALHETGRRLQDLLIEHSLQACGGDLHRLADVAELAQPDRWFLGSRRPLDQALGCRRSDVFVTEGHPWFLELNFGTCLNGTTSTPLLTDALLGSGPGRAVRHKHDLTAHSFLAARAAWVRRQRPRAVALLGFAAQGDDGSLRVFEAECDHLAAHGIPCDFVPMEEADVVDGAVCWRGKRYDLAIRYFMAGERVKQRHLDLVTAIEQASDTVLLGAYVSQLFTSKALLADLHCEPRLRLAQRALLDHVPWTARVRPARVPKGEGTVDPVEWAESNRERAVLKPYNLFGSRGVVLGNAVIEQQWRSALDTAVRDGGYVVQELVRPDAWTNWYWNLESDTLIMVDSPVLLGPYVVDGAPGGCFAQQPLSGAAEDMLNWQRGISFGCVVSAAR